MKSACVGVLSIIKLHQFQKCNHISDTNTMRNYQVNRNSTQQ